MCPITGCIVVVARGAAKPTPWAYLDTRRRFSGSGYLRQSVAPQGCLVTHHQARNA